MGRLWRLARGGQAGARRGRLAYDTRVTGSSYSTILRALEGKRLPLAFVDLDRFDTNATAIRLRAGRLPIRVASKSIRCAALLERLLERPAYEGVMAFSAAEVAWLAQRLVEGTDIFCAYPTVDPHDVGACLDASQRGARVALMVDHVEQVRRLGAMAKGKGATLRLMLDLDMSLRLPGLHFGVRRSPVHDVPGALCVAGAIAADPHLTLVGLMGYEAQIAGLPDGVARSEGRRARAQRAPFNAVVRTLKRASILDLQRRRGAVVRALYEAGHDLEIVNGGGTGSLESTARDPSLTECTAGSGLFSPTSFDGFAGFRHAPSAGFVLQVVRRAAPDIATCHGGGYPASGPGAPNRLPRPMWPPGLSLLPEEGAGEVQTPLRTTTHPLNIGDPVVFRHAKAGELCERFDALQLISGGEWIGEAKTYRGEGQCFL